MCMDREAGAICLLSASLWERETEKDQETQTKIEKPSIHFLQSQGDGGDGAVSTGSPANRHSLFPGLGALCRSLCPGCWSHNTLTALRMWGRIAAGVDLGSGEWLAPWRLWRPSCGSSGPDFRVEK